MRLFFEVYNRGFEHAKIVIAGNVYIKRQIVADALSMGHLAEYAAVGGGYALDGIYASVGVVRDRGCGAAGFGCVLGCDLTVFDHPVKNILYVLR